MQKLLRKKYKLSMTSKDALLQQMTDCGVNKSHFQANQDQYTQCPVCMEPFTASEPPVLFNCGHVACQKSCASNRYCAVCNSSNKTITQNPFNALLAYYNTDLQKATSKSYNFCIMKKTGAGKGEVVENVYGGSTVAELLDSSQDFRYFLQATGNNTGIVMNGKAFIYDQVKNKRLCDIQNLKLQANDGTTKRINEVSYVNRSLGGQP